MAKMILKIYLVLSLLLAADIAAYVFYKISLRGYYADIILFWLWISGSIAIVIAFWKKLWAKLFLGTMISGLILSMLPMGLPFYFLVFATTPAGLWMSKDLSKDYRAQIVSYSVMVPPWLQVIQKTGPFEKEILQCRDSQLQNDQMEVRIRNSKDIIFEKETDSTITLTLFYGGPNTILTFDKATGKILDQQ
ncbi:MAG: hypothetical protein LBE92_07245 [Chryseobacterium sp.]|jgi:hypothetical protein|uniref:hypothetical protein n=1 Tax=Chryseobacterium sp. TaxID=1871047 RepID=UPI002835E171|nr:hypothetical protein [Chryseobacterium sp.]MDR2235903.1 hypothetical protein [Chryseobacterium sp.]